MCILINAQATPLKFVPQTFVQPNGDTVYVYASGDEFYNWLHDQDNYTIIQDSTSGYLVYAAVENDQLIPTSNIVGKTDPKAARLIKGSNVFPKVSQGQTLAKNPTSSSISTSAVVGSRTNLVVFIRFKDEPEFIESIDEFNAKLNLPSGPSQKHYYREVSRDQLDINSVMVQGSANGIISYQDDQPRSYYLKYNAITNLNGYTSDRMTREYDLLRKALTSILPMIPATLNIDADADGKIDNVCFVVSGYKFPLKIDPHSQ